MKRCPDCEFIYEEHQSVCDMDGQTLVHDQLLSSNRVTAKTHLPTKSPKASSLSGIALPVSAGLLLATLFSVGYYSSSGSVAANIEPASIASDTTADIQTAATRALISSPELIAEASGVQSEDASLSDPEQKSVVAATPDSLTSPTHAHVEIAERRFPVVKGLPPLPRLRPLPRLPVATPLAKKTDSGRIVAAGLSARPTTARTESDASKKESRVGSFIKKTGRLLTKPFRL